MPNAAHPLTITASKTTVTVGGSYTVTIAALSSVHNVYINGQRAFSPGNCTASGCRRTFTYAAPTAGQFRYVATGMTVTAQGTQGEVSVSVTVTVRPSTSPVPVNAVLSDWSAWSGGAWSDCSPSSLQTRTETRTRTVVTPASNGGTTGPLSETRVATQSCVYTPPDTTPTDAVVSAWSAWVATSDWSTCIDSLQSRTEQRTRTIVTPATNGGGTPHLAETRTATQACSVSPPPPPNPTDAILSDWSAWVVVPGNDWSTCVAGSQSRPEQRTRTVLVPATNGGATGTLIEYRTATQSCTVVTPPPPPPGPRTVLQASDISFIGTILLPEDNPALGTRWGYSNAAIAGRRVNGQLRLFITGSSGQAGGGDYFGKGDAVYEVTPAASPFSARATLIRNWGEITQGKVNQRRDLNQGYEIRGLQWVNNQMWVAYGSQYFTGSAPDPSIVVCTLNDSTGAVASYGPWRTQEHSQKTRGYMVTIPDDFATAYTGGRKVAVGAPPTSGNAYGPRGSCLFALAPVPLSTPADPVESSAYSLVCQRLIYHDADHPQERNSNYKVCNWNVLYDYNQGGFFEPADPTFNNRDRALDKLSAAAWIQTSTKEGIFFLGEITDVIAGFTYINDTVPHLWYGGAGSPCVHGQYGNPSTGTGPQSPTSVPYVCIYNPSQLAQAATGAINPWAFTTASTFRLNTVTGASGTIPQQITTPYTYGGAYFDPTDNRLYITDVSGESLGEPRPVVRVFQIS